MIGNLSIGILARSSTGLEFVCGSCGEKSDLEPVHVPAAISFNDAATLHRCPHCGACSDESTIKDTPVALRID